MWAVFNKDKVPPPELPLPLAEKIKRLRLLLPTVLLIALVIGSIYTGIATATEAATLGVFGSLLLALFSGSLTWENFKESLIRRDADHLHDRLHHRVRRLPVRRDGLRRHSARAGAVDRARSICRRTG